VSTPLRCDVHPPLFYLWARPILWLAPDIRCLRVASLLLSVFSVLLLFLLARHLWGWGAASLSSLLFLLSPLRLSLSTYGRPFSFALLLDISALFAASLYIERGRRGALLLHSLLSVAATLTHALFALSLLGRLLGGFLSHRRRGFILSLSSLPAPLFLGLFYLLSPAGGAAFPRLGLAFLSGAFIALSEPAIGETWFGWPDGVLRALLPLSLLSAVALLGAVLCYKEGGGGRVISLSLGLGILGLGAVCGLELVQPLGRYAVITLGPFALCAARASWGWRRSLVQAFCRVCLGGLLAVGVGACFLLPRAQLTLDWPSLAKVVEGSVNPGEVLICDPPSSAIILRRYLKRHIRLVPEDEVWFTRLGHFSGPDGRALDISEARGEMRRASEGKKRLWLLRWSNAPPVWPRFPEELGYKRLLSMEFRGKVESALLLLYEQLSENGDCERARGGRLRAEPPAGIAATASGSGILSVRELRN